MEDKKAMQKSGSNIFATVFILALIAGGFYLGYYIGNKKIGEQNQKTQVTVKLYYYDQEKDKDEKGNILCSSKGLVAVERTIPQSVTILADTVRLLLSGDLKAIEREDGISTEFPLEGFSLADTSFSNQVLTLIFDDPNQKTSGGSCRAGILWSQIEATAKQFPEVQNVRFLPEELFQP